MKNLIFLLLATALVFASCEKDNDCDNPSHLPSVIVGEWNVTGWNGSVEFQADGEYIDDNEILVDNFNQLSMEYFVDSPTHLRIRVTPADYMFTVVDFDCNEINLSFGGFTYNLTKK